MPPIAAIVIAVTLFLMTFLIISGIKKYNADAVKSQNKLSDRDLLLLINDETDNIINSANLARKASISKMQAQSRLSKLMYAGLVNQMSSGFKSFYELKKPIESEDLISLSDKPYISIEDLFTLFEHYDQKMDLQDICVATGLPFKVIKREMKYFEKEGIIHEMTQHGANGFLSYKFYTLRDSYKGKREDQSIRSEKINLDLEKLYREEMDGDEFV